MNAIRITDAQLRQLNRLKSRFATQGYYVFLLARRRRKHQKEFVAVDRENDLRFAVVRLGGSGSIHIEPSHPKCEYPKMKKMVTEVRRHTPVYWEEPIDGNRQANLEHYIGPTSMKRLKKLKREEPPPQ